MKRRIKHTFYSDLQTVQVTLRILFRPEPTKLPSIFSNIGVDYDERVLPSITNEVLKATVVRQKSLDSRTVKNLSIKFSGAIRRSRNDHPA